MIISAYLGVAGLVDAGYRFYTITEATSGSRVTAGITDAGNGWYSADATVPANATSVRWDSTGTATAIAREYFDTLEATNFATVNTKLDAIDDYVDTEVAAILAKVNNLPSDPADASDIAAAISVTNGKVDTVIAKTNNLPSDPADASDIAASFATVNGTLATLSGYVDTEVAAILAAVDTEVAAIKAKTDNLPLDPADASDIAASFTVTNGKVDTVIAKTNNLPADPADASDIAAQFTTVNSNIATLTGYVDTEVAAIKSKTDALPSDPADASDIAASFTAVNTKLDAIDDFVDTEVAAIKVVTDKLDTALVVDGAVYQYTANALELGPAGGGGGGDASQATLLAVKAKTDNLPIDPADASDIAASFTITNGKVDAVAAKTNNLPADPADASDIAASFATVNTKLDSITAGLPLDAAELNAIADSLLKRDWTAVTGEAAYSLLNACRMLRNVWNTTGGVLSVKKEDATTNAWQRTLAVDPAAQPIVGAT